MTGRLVLCGTPIGHLGDASPRLAEVLGEADAIFAEDTRRARVLLDHLEVATTPQSYFIGNESRRLSRLTKLLEAGATVALLADAGMPTVCDPGFSAVRMARRIGAEVSVVPGPSAVVGALAVSGLPSDRFAFEGFLPRKGAERTRRLEQIAGETRTIVLFVPTARVRDDLSSLAEVLGGRRSVTVVRELTKAHEEVWSGTLEGAVAEWSRRAPRGEFTLVVAGWPGATTPMEHAVGEVMERKADGETMSEAVRTVADGLGLGRRSLYEAVLSELRP